MVQEIRETILRIQEVHRGDKNGMICAVHSLAANEHDSRELNPL
ncbi:MAG: hypothetical protein ACMUEL_01285 [Flavobacteriales bacterium Tduv]